MRKKRKRHLIRLMAPMTLIHQRSHCVKDLSSVLLMHHWVTLSQGVMATYSTKNAVAPQGKRVQLLLSIHQHKTQTLENLPCMRSHAHVICPVYCSGAPHWHEESHLHKLCSAAPSVLRTSCRCSYTAASCLSSLPADEGWYWSAWGWTYIVVLQKKKWRGKECWD